jgi:hypothetical protein
VEKPVHGPEEKVIRTPYLRPANAVKSHSHPPTSSSPGMAKSFSPHSPPMVLQLRWKAFCSCGWYYNVVLRLGRLVTVSAKVDEKLRKRARRLGVNISEVVRKALEEEVRRAELKELVKVFAGEVDSSPRLPEGMVVEIIREMRRGSVAEGW